MPTVILIWCGFGTKSGMARIICNSNSMVTHQADDGTHISFVCHIVHHPHICISQLRKQAQWSHRPPLWPLDWLVYYSRWSCSLLLQLEFSLTIQRKPNAIFQHWCQLWPLMIRSHATDHKTNFCAKVSQNPFKARDLRRDNFMC